METEEKGQAIASPLAQSEGDLVIRQAHSSYDWALFPLRVMIFFKLCEGKVIDKPWLKTIIKDSKDINIIVLFQAVPLYPYIQGPHILQLSAIILNTYVICNM